MILYILASLIIFSLVILHSTNRGRRIQKQADKAFWDKEVQANSTRRRSLEDLDYIRVPLDSLPIQILSDDPEVADCLSTIKGLSDAGIVNFTGCTNTELKLNYGAANFPLLAEYDQNYTILVRTLQRWSDCLYRQYPDAAGAILEYAVSIGTDIGRSYYALADLYAAGGEYDKIEQLSKNAALLNSANKNAIVRRLQTAYSEAGQPHSV